MSSSNAAPSSAKDIAIHAVRALQFALSVTLGISAVVFVCYSIGAGYTALEAPAIVQLMWLLVCLSALAYVEAIQVAVLLLVGKDSSAFSGYPYAKDLMSNLMQGENLQRFLVGRQTYQMGAFLMLLQVSATPGMVRPESVHPMIWWLAFETHLPGFFMILIFGQIVPQLLAAREPAAMCNSTLAAIAVRAVMFMEAVGVMHFAWALAALVGTVIARCTRSSAASAAPTPTGFMTDLDLEAGHQEKIGKSILTEKQQHVEETKPAALPLEIPSFALEGSKLGEDLDEKAESSATTDEGLPEKVVESEGHDSEAGEAVELGISESQNNQAVFRQPVIQGL